MPLDVLVHVSEDSLRGQVIQEIADEQQVTPEIVIEQIIDAEIIHGAMAIACEERHCPPSESENCA